MYICIKLHLKLYKDCPELRKREAEQEAIERQENLEKYQATRERLVRVIKIMLPYGETIDSISEILDRPVEEIKPLVSKIKSYFRTSKLPI